MKNEEIYFQNKAFSTGVIDMRLLKANTECNAEVLEIV